MDNAKAMVIYKFPVTPETYAASKSNRSPRIKQGDHVDMMQRKHTAEAARRRAQSNAKRELVGVQGQNIVQSTNQDNRPVAFPVLNQALEVNLR